MSQETNLNVSPYFDDFDKDKNYYRVLVKPEYPIQAREINNLQSILQNQVESLGNHFFKEGSVVIPGQTSYNRFYNAVQIQSTFSGINVEDYISTLVGKKIIGETSKVEAIIDGFLTAADSVKNTTTIYVNYITASANNNTTTTFVDGENILAQESFVNSLAAFDVGQAVAKTLSANCNSLASAFKVSEGVYYLRGHFVNVDTQTIILDQYTNTPTYKVGFSIVEEIITSDIDSSLTDNAKGFNNYAAPGADRFKITAILDKKEVDDQITSNFIEIARIENGTIRNVPNNPTYNIIEDKFAKRTFEESGDYYVNRFDLSCVESLNDRIGNNGIFYENSKTYQGNVVSDDLAIYKISPGKAYVRGYEVEINSPTLLDVEKPRETKFTGNQTVIYSTGTTLSLNRVYGTPQIGIGNTFTLSLRDSRIGINSATAGGDEIGVARVYDFALESGSYHSLLNTNVWDVTLYDIQPYTKVTLNQPITLATPAYFVGNSSGATGYLKTSVTNSTVVTLYNVTGKFVNNESFTINGANNSRIAVAVRTFDISNVKSVYGTSTYGTFNADVVQSQHTNIGICSISAASANTSNIYINGSNYLNTFSEKDLVVFSNPATSTLPIVGTVGSITSDSQSTILSVTGITTVAGVYDGGMPTSSITVTDLRLLKTDVPASTKTSLYTPLAKNNVKSVVLNDSNLVIRKQYKVDISANSTNTVSTDNANFTFLPFDEERYSLIRSNGQIESLSADRFEISPDGRQLKINGLGANDTNSILITTQRKIGITSKQKKKTRANSIVVDKSTLRSSGIGTTTRNDNLTFGNYPYGTRVQDFEISLNVPDVTVVHGIFEAQNGQEPSAPKMVLSNISPTNNTSSIFVGEQLIGQSSGAVAICAGIVDSNKIFFISKNKSPFQNNEVVSFKESKITATVAEIQVTSKEITDSYVFNNGQRDSFYDYSRIIRKNTAVAPQSKIRIYFDNLYYDAQDQGDITTANSYSTFDYKNDIQYCNNLRNTDILDIRPRVDQYNVLENAKSPFEFDGRTFVQAGNSASNILASDEDLLLNVEYYLPRIDRVFLNKNGNFVIQKGTSNDNPSLPQAIDDSIEIAKISLPPYLFDTSNATITSYDYKRYQMSDISKLETRIKNLETYTTLSLLESETSNLFIPDNSNLGLNRFKSGFFVDNFRNFLPQDDTIGIRNSVDPIKGGLRPSHYTNSIDLIVGTKNNVGAGTTTNIDYSNISTDDILGQNIQKTGDIITLKYDNIVWLNQPYATRVENVQPFILSFWEGTIKLNPSSDIWVDTVKLNPKTVTVEGDYLATLNRLSVTNGVDAQTGFGPIIWGSWSLAGFGNPRWVKANDGVTSVIGPWTWLRTGGTWSAEVVDATFTRSGKQTVVTESFDTKSLGDSIIAVDMIPNMRSRNIEFNCKGFQKGITVYPFFEQVSVAAYCFPKLLEITMISGVFAIGERVRVEVPSNNNIVEGYFRAAKPNHKSGKFDSPTETYTVEPYQNTSVPENYSSTSKIINVDTASLSLKSDGNYYGRVQAGYILIGESSGARATVNQIRLISDNNGEVLGSFYVPNPNIPEAPTFTAGTKIFKLTSQQDNNPTPGVPLSSAESKFYSEGKLQTIQEKLISIRNASVTTNTFTENKTEAAFTGLYVDPLAQSFSCDDPTGVYLTKIDVFFESKDASIPVTCQLRTMELGVPTKKVIPFSEVSLKPDQVSVSADSSLSTTFTFESPVYIEGNQEYAIVLLSNSTSYRVWISRLGENDRLTNKVVETQPTLGSLFKSQNASTWTPSQFEDLKFKLYRAEYSATTGFINFFNPDLSEGNSQVLTLTNNPLDFISRRVRVGLASTITESDSDFKFGQTVYQPSTTAKGIYISKVGIATGGTGNGGLSITSAGIGYTPSSGSFTFNNVPLTSVTGSGRNATANITISDGVAIGATIVNGGSGYQIGDVLYPTQIGANTLGRNLRISIGTINQFNEIVLDNVQGSFATGVGIGNSLQYYNSTNVLTQLNSASGGNVLVNSPIIIENDGLHFRVKQSNHGMHSKLNYVTIKNVSPDTQVAKLTTALTNNSTSGVIVSDGTLFQAFEGYAVSGNNPGYITINNEIIKYTSVSGNTLGGITRAIDSTIAVAHANNSDVYKYEINGVSLLRINKTHRLEDATISDQIGLDYYSIKFSQNYEEVGTKLITDRTGAATYPALYFNTSKSSGGDKVKATQNMQFELLTPVVETFIPNNTSISSQVRTVSATSVSGNETSFIDKGFSSVTLGEYNYFDSPRLIASKINETNILQAKSFNLITTLSTVDSRLSPCIDLSRISVITTTNRINKIVDNYAGDNRVNSLTRDQNAFLYVSKPYRLELPATSIKLFVSADVNAYCDIRALYAIGMEDNQNPIFELFPGYNNIDSLGNTINYSLNDGTPDRPFIKNNDLSFVPENYRDYEFTSHNLPLFKYFRIKLILTSTTQSFVPKLQNIRVIALA